MFEIKVYNTALTANQPLSYYDYLKDKSAAKYKALVLIAPGNYYDLDNYTRFLSSVKAEGDNSGTSGRLRQQREFFACSLEVEEKKCLRAIFNCKLRTKK